VRPWLYRIAHNESITLLRRPRTESADDAEVSTIDDVEASAAVRAQLRTILADIRELPERQRGALVMREMAGLGYDEIAEALGTSADGAKQAVYDARVALHERASGRESACDTIRHKLSTGDRRVFRGRAIRAHLTACSDCRSFQATMVSREAGLAAFAPVMPAAAAASVLPGAVGGGAGAAAGFAGLGATATGPRARSGRARRARVDRRRREEGAVRGRHHRGGRQAGGNTQGDQPGTQAQPQGDPDGPGA
jgi:hypothetical protein